MDKEMRKKPKAKFSAKRDGDRAVFDIVCDPRKQKNGDKFIRLYDKGDFSEKTIESYKLASIVTLDEDFVNDAGFDTEKYLTGCRCQILHLMYADTPIVRIWQNRE